MKTVLQFTFYLLVVMTTTFSLGQTDSVRMALLQKRIPAWVKPVIAKSEVAQNYQIIDSINPFYLEADLTGDKQDDIVLFVRNKFDGKRGIMIINRGKNLLFVLGAGKDIGMGDHINWCSAWFVYRERGLIDGNGRRKSTLKYPAIRLEKSEKISLFIYWTGKKYKTFAQVNNT